MQMLILLVLAMSTASCLNGQNDTVNGTYVTRISSIEWMPEGNSLLLGIVKHHKTDRQAPFYSKVVLYDLQTRNLTPLFDDGSSLSVSPDGSTIAYLKRSEQNRKDIHFYKLLSGESSVMKIDTLAKFALNWAKDGKHLVYNTRTGKGPTAAIDICVLNLATKQARQISKIGKDKSYNPTPCPDGKLIAYYLEKGDGHDQIWLTDINGSFHKNLTNDTATHNYYPAWIDDQKIFYTQSPATIMTMDADGNNKQKIEGINAEQVSYNSKTMRFAYIKSEEENKLVVYDWKTKKGEEVLDGTSMMGLFK
jgi:Tol biopolymer transport system component